MCTVTMAPGIFTFCWGLSVIYGCRC